MLKRSLVNAPDSLIDEIGDNIQDHVGDAEADRGYVGPVNFQKERPYDDEDDQIREEKDKPGHRGSAADQGSITMNDKISMKRKIMDVLLSAMAAASGKSKKALADEIITAFETWKAVFTVSAMVQAPRRNPKITDDVNAIAAEHLPKIMELYGKHDPRPKVTDAVTKINDLVSATKSKLMLSVGKLGDNTAKIENAVAELTAEFKKLPDTDETGKEAAERITKELAELDKLREPLLADLKKAEKLGDKKFGVIIGDVETNLKALEKRLKAMYGEYSSKDKPGDKPKGGEPAAPPAPPAKSTPAPRPKPVDPKEYADKMTDKSKPKSSLDGLAVTASDESELDKAASAVSASVDEAMEILNEALPGIDAANEKMDSAAAHVESIMSSIPDLAVPEEGGDAPAPEMGPDTEEMLNEIAPAAPKAPAEEDKELALSNGLEDAWTREADVKLYPSEHDLSGGVWDLVDVVEADGSGDGEKKQQFVINKDLKSRITKKIRDIQAGSFTPGQKVCVDNGDNLIEATIKAYAGEGMYDVEVNGEVMRGPAECIFVPREDLWR